MPSDANRSTVHLLPETRNSGEGTWVREPRSIVTQRADDPRNRVAVYDARTPHDRLEARVAELEARLGSPTDKVVCCHTRFGAPCIRWTTRVNAEDNWAYVGACYYCPQCWGHICAGR